MKLELKHIAHYLPYRLKFIWQKNTEWEYFELFSEYTKIGGITINQALNYDKFEAKPILRPLSDLTKKIQIDNEIFIPIKKLQKIFTKRLRFDEDGFYYHINPTVVNRGGDSHFPFNQLKAYSYIFEWHFDVFGLIKQELAIDINTLK